MNKDVEDLFIEGQFKFMDEDLEGCIKIFTDVLDIDPGYLKAYQARAVALFKMGREDEAIQDIESAIKYDPGNSRLHYHKGAMFFKMNLFDEAIEALSQAIGIDPTNAPAYLLRGHIYEKLGNDEEAGRDLSQAMALRKETDKEERFVDF